MRDLDEKPYSAEEARISAFFAERGTGGGDDPVGAMLASYAYLIEERKSLRTALGPFASGGDWGVVLARISAGAPTKADGIAMCRQIVKWQRAADEALALR